MDKIRCSNCRGMKQVAKLGGMMGDCNLCAGTGLISIEDRAKVAVAQVVEPVADIISQVSKVVPKAIKIENIPKHSHPTSNQDKDLAAQLEPTIKIDPKKAIYKRKKA